MISEDVIAFGAEHSTLGPIVERAAAQMNVRLSPDPLPEQGLFTRSDHYEFVRVGVPSVFLMTGFAGEGRRRFTAFPRRQLSQRERRPQPALRLGRRRQVRAFELSDRARDCRRGRRAALVCGQLLRRGGRRPPAARAQRVSGDGQAASR